MVSRWWLGRDSVRLASSVEASSCSSIVVQHDAGHDVARHYASSLGVGELCEVSRHPQFTRSWKRSFAARSRALGLRIAHRNDLLSLPLAFRAPLVMSLAFTKQVLLYAALAYGVLFAVAGLLWWRLEAATPIE